jgi:hypothetical protein
MKVFYVLTFPDHLYDEGPNEETWFTSLAAARSERAKRIKADPTLEENQGVPTFGIDRVQITDQLTGNRLLLAVLNREGFVTQRENVVPEYEPEDE